MPANPPPKESASQIGRWTLGPEVGMIEPSTPMVAMPVVPCDDAAVERLARHLYDSDDERVRVEGVAWVNEPDGYKGMWRDRAREACRVLALESYS